MKHTIEQVLLALTLLSGPITFMSIGAWLCLTYDGDWRLW